MNKKKPNILLLFPDQHRGDWMPYDKEIMHEFGMDELPLKMPNIEKLMENGVTFPRTVTSSPLCAPARACLASGLRYDKCNVSDNNVDYPIGQKTFYNVLKDAGYNVGGVGKFDVHKKTSWWGLDGWVEQLGQIGFTHAIDNEGKWDAIRSGSDEPKGPYMKYLHDSGMVNIHIDDMNARRRKPLYAKCTDLPDEAYCDNWLSQNAITMLSKFEKQKPWFLQVNFTGPHYPWDVTQNMKESWKNVGFSIPNSMGDMDKDAINSVRQNYAAMLQNIDKNIGLILDKVKDRGELDNTVIIYSSDHGEMLGDFEKFGKNIYLRGSVHIPLVISAPGLQKNCIRKQLVELQDLTSTIVSLAGCDMPEAKDSISLVPVLKGVEGAVKRQYITSGLKDWRLICDEKYKAIFKCDEKIKLFDIQEDPWENNDIAEENPEAVQKISMYLDDLIQGAR